MTHTEQPRPSVTEGPRDQPFLDEAIGGCPESVTSAFCNLFRNP